MNTVYKLDKSDLSKAVADWVARRIGADVEGQTTFHVEADYDFADRPTGTHTISASFAVKPAKRKDPTNEHG